MQCVPGLPFPSPRRPGDEASKCVAVHFSSQPQQSTTYSIGETSVPFLEIQRDLGVTVSGTLKAYKFLHVIRRNVPPSSPQETTVLDISEVSCIAVSYGGHLWLKTFSRLRRFNVGPPNTF